MPWNCSIGREQKKKEKKVGLRTFQNLTNMSSNRGRSQTDFLSHKTVNLFSRKKIDFFSPPKTDLFPRPSPTQGKLKRRHRTSLQTDFVFWNRASLSHTAHQETRSTMDAKTAAKPVAPLAVGTVDRNVKPGTKAGAQMGPKMRCFNCNQKGHGQRECMEPLKCNNCLQLGHPPNFCPEPPVLRCRNCLVIGHAAVDCKANVECRNCHQMGHVKKDCPTLDNTCRNCGQTGHHAKSCTICATCGSTEHKTKKCLTTSKCRRCRNIGHLAKDCPTQACKLCGVNGHGETRCPQRTIDNETAGGGWGGGGKEASGTGGITPGMNW